MVLWIYLCSTFDFSGFVVNLLRFFLSINLFLQEKKGYCSIQKLLWTKYAKIIDLLDFKKIGPLKNYNLAGYGFWT